jgi:hypothetical protein
MTVNQNRQAMNLSSFLHKYFNPISIFTVSIAATIVTCALTIGCKGSSSENSSELQTPQQGDTTHFGRIVPLNGQQTSGDVKISIEGDVIKVEMTISGVAPRITHLQYVYFGERCPTYASDDSNNDGYVDIIEGIDVFGPILIPLDDSLSTQAVGTYPIADASGRYVYTAQGSVSALLADLHSPDPDPSDSVGKLDPRDGLSLQNRVIVIHGVASSTFLPSTVDSLPGLSPQITLPVGCAEIAPQSELPTQPSSPSLLRQIAPEASH